MPGGGCRPQRVIGFVAFDSGRLIIFWLLWWKVDGSPKRGGKTSRFPWAFVKAGGRTHQQGHQRDRD